MLINPKWRNIPLIDLDVRLGATGEQYQAPSTNRYGSDSGNPGHYNIAFNHFGDPRAAPPMA